MKQILKLSLLLLALLLPTTATAHDFEVDGIYYNINGNEATVTYRGTSYSQYDEYSGSVTIPETVTYNGTTYSVTAISNSAFRGCSGLTSVNIPNSVTVIGSKAFWFCSGLTSIDIPNSVTTIGNYAFRGCSGLTSITISNSVTTIGNEAFYNCSGLTSVTIPNSVTTIGGGAFYNCSGLTSVTIPNSVTTIGSSAFYGTAWYNNQPDGLVYAGLVAYQYKGDMPANTHITLREGTLGIAGSAFYGCSGLTSIDIPNAVTTIGNHAFWGCSGLTSIDIPNAVTTIGDWAFAGCTGLTSANIGNSVTEIGNSAFSGCTGLTSVTIPNSVTTIGEQAFYGCSALTSVTIPNSVTTIGSEAFYGCSALTSVTIPNSVTTIGSEAFYGCSGLTSITIPNSVTTISNSTFYNCSGLTSVTIPNSVTTIGNYAFRGCSGLTSIQVESGNVVYDSRDNCNAIIETASNTLITGCKTTIIPNSVTTIGNFAFYYCSGLTSVNIPNSVTTIDYSAFQNCSGLTSVTIPNSVTTIGNSAFQNCSGLTSVTIPNSVTEIAIGAFYNCSGLTSVTIPNSVTAIGDFAFYRCSGLTSITIPNSVTFIGNNAFLDCDGLDDVYCYISDPSLVTVGPFAFACNSNYSARTLHVPVGSLEAYQADTNWSRYFGSIVEMSILATSISLNNTVTELTEGENFQLIATVLPSNATNKTVTWSTSNSSVATVNSNGLVTAHAVGGATITATTTDGTDLSASCSVTVNEDLSNYDNYLSMDNIEAFQGDTIVIPVKMTNAVSIISFQTDIFLPEGLELLKEDGEYMIDPSERMTRTHTIMSNDVSNGAVRVICYSSNYKPFTGNSGDDLFYITVKVADDAEGDYTVQMRNTLLTTSDFEEIAAPDVAANVNVKAYLLGDANNSGTVTITDVVVTSQYVLEMNPQTFVFEAADVNFDNNITVTDVSRIAWMVLNPDEANAPMRASVIMDCSDHMSGEGITLATGETRTVSIALNNTMDYTACQLDLRLPEGLTASNFRLTDRAGSHVFDVNTLHNGDIRVLCYSPALTAIGGHEGALLTFDVTATAPVTGDIAVDGIELVTTACQTVKPDGFVIGVNAATSINEIACSKTVARVEYFNVAGQRVDRPDSGVILVVTTYTDGTRTTTKLIR